MSQDSAAADVGINRVLLTYYEGDRRQIPYRVASELARLYGTTLDALEGHAEEKPSDVDVEGLVERAAARPLGEKAQASVRIFSRRITRYVELAQELELLLPGRERTPFPPAQASSAREAAWAVRQLRRYFELDGRAPGDLFRSFDEHVLIWRLPLGANPDDSPSGFFFNHPMAGFCVVVNSQFTVGRQAFSLGHELGHAFFQSHETDVLVSMKDADVSREAFPQVFASELLVPTDELRRQVGQLSPFGDMSDPTMVVYLQHYFGVSFVAMAARLFQEKYIYPAEHDALARLSPTRLAQAHGYEEHPEDRGGATVHPLAMQPSRVLLLVRTALDRSVITVREAATILGIPSAQVRQVMARPTATQAERRGFEDLEAAMFAPHSH